MNNSDDAVKDVCPFRKVVQTRGYENFEFFC